MKTYKNSQSEPVRFKIRFNTMHGSTALYWRIIIGNEEFLASTITCLVPTYSESSFDSNANAIKFHMAGKCTKFELDEQDNAIFK